MNLSVVASRPHRGALPSASAAQERERRVLRRVRVAWSLLVLNALTYSPGGLLHLPSVVGKSITQGSLIAALLVALSVNRKVIARPNVFLCLMSLLVLEALITILPPPHLGTVYRTFRFAGFITVLWLLTPWWGRRDLLLLRVHRGVLAAVLGTVLLGLIVAPGRARAGGRLADIVWPTAPTQIAHYAAVYIGLTIVLWLCGEQRGRVTALVVLIAGPILILTHTRTALTGLIVGLLVAGLSLIVAKARVRKIFAIGGVVAAITIATLSNVLITWLARGEGTQQLYNLTGRTVVWSALVNAPRDRFQALFGFGLSNDSFGGLSIDSNWLATYQAQGLIGVTICAATLLFLLVTAYFQPRGVQRALALFLIVYSLIASFTEVSFSNPTVYLLELALAASMFVPTSAKSETV